MRPVWDFRIAAKAIPDCLAGSPVCWQVAPSTAWRLQQTASTLHQWQGPSGGHLRRGTPRVQPHSGQLQADSPNGSQDHYKTEKATGLGSTKVWRSHHVTLDDTTCQQWHSSEECSEYRNNQCNSISLVKTSRTLRRILVANATQTHNPTT